MIVRMYQVHLAYLKHSAQESCGSKVRMLATALSEAFATQWARSHHVLRM